MSFVAAKLLLSGNHNSNSARQGMIRASEIKLPLIIALKNKLSDEINPYLKAVAVFNILQLLSKNGLFHQITCFMQFFLNGSLKLFPVPMRN